MSETSSQNEHTPNEHTWFREHIASALAGGLGAAERMRFEAHAIECEPCSAELSAHEEMERKMAGMFALPAPGLEDRLIDSLRIARERWRPIAFLHPAVRRAAAGVAAVLAIAAVGYAVNQQLEPPPQYSAAGYAQNVATTQPAGSRFNTILGREFAVAADVNPANHWFGNDYNYSDWDADENGRTAGESRYETGFARHAAVVPGAKVPEQQAAKRPQTNWAGVLNGEPAASNYFMDGNVAAGGVYFKPADISLKTTAEKNVELIRSGVVAGKPSSAGTLVLNGSNLYGGDGVVALGEKVQAVQQMAQAVPQPPAVAGTNVVAAGQPDQLGKPAEADTRRIIRTGQLEFEVDRYDAAFAQVSKLTTEAGGYIGTTDSEKLPNGKVKGTLTLRVPPDRLDTLVLQLRGIGDLKSQKLDANDVSRQYTDLESELKAARAMEERLLAIIKDGKGEIKDLLAAEKELGNWRTKIEKIVGQVKFFDNQVSLSTLVVSLFERDIRTPATAQQTETINAGVQASDVEKARADALKAVEDAKGRVIQSELRRHDAGQFEATIVAEVSPDASGQLLDRLKQIGKVARLDIQRKQTSEPQADSAAPLKVENKPTRLNLSLYNLANVAPRMSSSVNLAADDVEAAYRAILERVNKGGGRVLTSNLAKGKPQQATGTIQFEVPAADADPMLNELRTLGDVVNLTVTQNPDVENSTDAKRGFALSLASTASIPPREVMEMTVETTNVDDAAAKLQAAVAQAGGRVIESKIAREREGKSLARLAFEAPLDQSNSLVDQAKTQGSVRAMQSSRNLDAPAGPRAKVRILLQIVSPDTLVDAGSGPWATIRNGLATSANALLKSLELVIIGICFVLPMAAVLWVVWKVLKRTLRRDVGAGAA